MGKEAECVMNKIKFLIICFVLFVPNKSFAERFFTDFMSTTVDFLIQSEGIPDKIDIEVGWAPILTYNYLNKEYNKYYYDVSYFVLGGKIVGMAYLNKDYEYEIDSLDIFWQNLNFCENMGADRNAVINRYGIPQHHFISPFEILEEITYNFSTTDKIFLKTVYSLENNAVFVSSWHYFDSLPNETALDFAFDMDNKLHALGAFNQLSQIYNNGYYSCTNYIVNKLACLYYIIKVSDDNINFRLYVYDKNAQGPTATEYKHSLELHIKHYQPCG